MNRSNLYFERWRMLFLLLLSICGCLSTAQSDSEPTYLSDFESGVSGRVVNGQDAAPDRYPYYVALFDKNDNLRCGGTLIAPNIVLSAAHCQARIDYVRVGYYSTDDDDVERINIVGRYPNPMWVFDLYSFDHLVLVLETSSNKIPIRINLDPNVPDVNATNPGILIGFGKVGSNAVGDDPVTLQETNITFLDNGECEEVENVETGELIFLDRIKDDMICVVGADGNGSGQCSGDSGGPYLIPSENGDPEGDLQVGLVSWSYGGTCSAEYPAVGARTSVFEWIRLATCQYALTPPEYMNCDDDSITFSPAPTPAPAVPTTSPAPTEAAVSITLSFYFDDEPHEVSWSIFESETEQVMLQRPAFYYPRDIELVRETLLLSPGRYTLTVEDSHGDGINNGEEVAYDVTLTNEATKSKFLLLERAGNFRVKRTETFVVPSVEEYPTESPSAAPSLSIAPTATTVDVYLTIDLDDWYKETGWSIYDANDPSVVFGEVLPGEYTTGGNVTETITLPYPGGDFVFEIEDNFGDGLLEGQGDGYSLWVLDSATGDQIVLVEGSGDFEDGTVHNFTLPELTME